MNKILLILIGIFTGIATLEAQTNAEKIKALEEEIEINKLQEILDSLKRKRNNVAVDIPCINEILKQDPNYITTLGIGEAHINPSSEAEARQNALINAKLEIAQKWVGSINNTIEKYYELTNESDGNRSKLKQVLKTSGEKAINNFMITTCEKLLMKEEAKRTSLIYYVAVKIPISEIVTTVIQESKKINLPINKKKIEEVIVINPRISN